MLLKILTLLQLYCSEVTGGKEPFDPKLCTDTFRFWDCEFVYSRSRNKFEDITVFMAEVNCTCDGSLGYLFLPSDPGACQVSDDGSDCWTKCCRFNKPNVPDICGAGRKCALVNGPLIHRDVISFRKGQDVGLRENWEDCASACRDASDCRFFSWTNVSFAPGGEKKCSLMTRASVWLGSSIYYTKENSVSGEIIKTKNLGEVCHLERVNIAKGIVWQIYKGGEWDPHVQSNRVNSCPASGIFEWKGCRKTKCIPKGDRAREAKLPQKDSTKLCSPLDISESTCTLILLCSISLCVIVCVAALKYARSKRWWKKRPSNGQKTTPRKDWPPKFFPNGPMTLKEISTKMEDETFSNSLETEYTEVVKKCDKIPKAFSFGNRLENIGRNLDIDNLILPYDDNRVKLKNLGVNSPNDYVNASYMRSMNLKEDIIVTGLPRDKKPETLLVFWQMIHENEVENIILTVDSSKEFNIFPTGVGRKNRLVVPNGSESPLTVELLEEPKNSLGVVTRKLKVEFQRKEVKVKQQVINSTQRTEKDIKTFLETVKTTWHEVEQNKYKAGPVVIYGDCGNKHPATYLAVLLLIKEEEENKEVSLPDTLARLRLDRMDMIPKYGDYLFLYKSMAALYDVKKTTESIESLSLYDIKRRTLRFIENLRHPHHNDRRTHHLGEEEEEAGGYTHPSIALAPLAQPVVDPRPLV